MKEKYFLLVELCDFYYLQRLSLPDMPPTVQARALQLLEEYTPLLARQIFDYSFAVCLGEARHADSKCEKCFDWEYESSDSREWVYKHASKYNPDQVLPKLIELFTEYYWRSSYGGTSWGRIAEAAYKYWKGEYTHSQYIDVVVYLNHNGGLYFDKPCIFTGIEEGKLVRFLDIKRHYDIINDVEHLLDFRYTWGQIGLSTPVYNLVRRVFPEDEETFNRIFDAFASGTILTDGYIPISYGDETVEIVDSPLYDDYEDEEEEYYDEDEEDVDEYEDSEASFVAHQQYLVAILSDAKRC